MGDPVVRQRPDCQCTARASSAEQQQQSDDRSIIRANSAEHDQRIARSELQMLQQPNGMWIHGGPGAILPRYIPLPTTQPPQDGRQAQQAPNGALKQQLIIGGPQAIPDPYATRLPIEPSQDKTEQTSNISQDEGPIEASNPQSTRQPALTAPHKPQLRQSIRAHIRKIWYYGPFSDDPVTGEGRKDFTPQEKQGMESRRQELLHARAERAKRK
jgi:hypothetical protein